MVNGNELKECAQMDHCFYGYNMVIIDSNYLLYIILYDEKISNFRWKASEEQLISDDP